MFSCSRCLKPFDTKFNLNRHTNRKQPCEIPVTKKDDELDEAIICDYCKKVFSSTFNLERHLYNSPTAPCAIERALKDKLLPKNPGTVINNSFTTNNLTNNNIIQPIFAEHGKESIYHITREIILALLDSHSFSDMCSELMRLLYFNKDIPQNSNWMIAYPKNGKAGVSYNYNSNQFERKFTTDIIDDKFSNMMNLLQPLIEQILKEDERDNILNPTQKKNIARYYVHFGMMEVSKESPEVYEKIRDMAFNHKTISTTSWKQQGLNANHLSIKF